MLSTRPYLFEHFEHFEHLNRLLDPFNPAELHGLLCGLLCADAALDRDRWLGVVRQELAAEGEIAEPVRDLLAKLLEYGTSQLNDSDGSVTLLLPDDAVPLPQRVDALGIWCQSLLYGLGLGQVDRRSPLSKESQEFLRDVVAIAQADLDSDQADETAEIAYAELVEYLRVGLLTIFQDAQHATLPAAERRH